MSTESLSIKSNSSQVDLKSIPEACNGMATAVVTFYVTEQGRLGRMVTVFDTGDIPFDHVPMGHSKIIESLGNVKCFKPILYRLDGLDMKKSGIAWPTIIKEP